MRTSEIRQRFIDFYKAEDYRVLPRASMLDDSIPMSFVMSAGLVQVEQSLAKQNARNSNRFVLVQDCFRHFDLDKVGKDDSHLSIFEMPGAFKFGPDGKIDTVRKMWYLATSVLGINKYRLWASYFKGGEILGNEMPEDDIVRRTWLELGISPEHIVGLGYKDNFWLQGKGFSGSDIVQKSGPNTELFYDRGEDKACGVHCLPGCKCGRFMEFSNSLFICYEVDPDNGRFKRLDDPFSETVIGTERVAMILQRRDSVFEIDSYQSILDTIRKFIPVDTLNRPWIVESERVIADHLKALYLLVADHAPPPGKNGRARIIKLLIRGVITREIFLGITSDDFVPTVLDCVAQVIRHVEVNTEVRKRIEQYFQDQRDCFKKTIERGKRELVAILNSNTGRTLSGIQIVELEKRFGLPWLLIAKTLSEQSLQFREDEYKSELMRWRSDILDNEYD
ncbi:MAG: alanine--tRNA ligase-related protein [Chloroflexota bacterium]